MTTAPTLLKVAGNAALAQPVGHLPHTLPTRLIISIKHEVTGGVVLGQQIAAKRDCAAQMGFDERVCQRLVNADIAPIVKLLGVDIMTLDEATYQHIRQVVKRLMGYCSLEEGHRAEV